MTELTFMSSCKQDLRWVGCTSWHAAHPKEIVAEVQNKISRLLKVLIVGK